MPYIKSFYEDQNYLGWRVARESTALEREALAFWSVPGVLQHLIYPTPVAGKNRAVEIIIPPKLFSRIQLQFSPEALENLEAIKLDFKDYGIRLVPLSELSASAGSALSPRALWAPSEESDRPVKLAVTPQVRKSEKSTAAFQVQLKLKIQ